MTSVAREPLGADEDLRARLQEVTVADGLEAATLPPEAYWSEELYQRELETIFFKEWLCVGRVEDVANPGDFFTYDVASEPLIIVRDHEGVIHAHLNVCRHRACPVVEGSGNTPAFKCPYHGWMYGLAGDLRGAPEFRYTKNFNKAEYPLVSAQVETWEGFIMVNLDPDAAAFAPRVSESSKFGAEKYHMGDQLTIKTWHHRLNCNWKAWIENSIEEYHIPWVHAATFQPVSPMKGWVDFPDITDQPWIVMVGQFPGFSMSNTGEARFPVSPDTADLPPEYDGVPIWVVYPAFGMLNTVDSTLYYTVHPAGPERCDLRLGLTLPRESVEAIAAGDPEAKEAADEYIANCEAFLVEDNTITEKQHTGLRSVKSRTGRYSKHEILAWKFDKWVAERAYL